MLTIMRGNYYTATYIVITSILFIASFFLPESGSVADVKIVDPAKAALDSMNENVKLIGTINTALFGTCGALAVKGSEWSTRWGHTEAICIVIALIAGAASYYGTYIVNSSILQMVYYSTFDPFSRKLQTALSLQYYGVLCGFFLLGLVFVRMLESKKIS